MTPGAETPLKKAVTSSRFLPGKAPLAQGRYADAEPLYKRALAIHEKVLGPEHPLVAQSLENYAILLRKTGRDIAAQNLEASAKHAKENP